MNLSDYLPESLKKSFAENNIEIGKTFLIEIEEFQIEHSKFIIIVSENEENFILAFVVINSLINENVNYNTYLKNLHIEITPEQYSFLNHKSFIDCSELLTIEKQKLIEKIITNPECIKGIISDETLRKVHQKITDNTIIPRKLKKKFGFI